MPSKEEFDAAIGELDAVTVDLQEDMQRLRDNAFIPQEVLDTLNLKIQTLKDLGSQQ